LEARCGGCRESMESLYLVDNTQHVRFDEIPAGTKTASCTCDCGSKGTKVCDCYFSVKVESSDYHFKTVWKENGNPPACACLGDIVNLRTETVERSINTGRKTCTTEGSLARCTDCSC
jgi:hypothetical protein